MMASPRHVLTLPGEPAREVYVEPDSGVLQVRSAFASDDYKRTYDVFVDAYRDFGLLGRMRDRFHSIQARLYAPDRGPWGEVMARLSTPVPRVLRFGKFLDIGCNTASLLSKLPDPWERYGVEINAEAVRAARKHSNVEIFEGSLEWLETDLQFDFVRASHVIEHVEDYESFLRQLYKLTAEDGYVLLYTPNTASLSLRVFRKHWGPFYELTHARLFSLRNLSAACERVGFEVVERGTYYMGVAVESLLRASRISPSSRLFKLAFFLLLVALYPAGLLVSWLRMGGALYLYLRKPGVHTPQRGLSPHS